MAIDNDLDAGLDITALSVATPSQVYQITSAASPKADKGFLLYGATVPDVANNPRYARYLWIDTSVSVALATLKRWNGAAWILVTTPAGAVSIDTAELVDGAVTTAKIADGAVDTTELKDGSVTNAKLATNSVTGTKIVNGTISGVKLADGSITTEKISLEAVTVDQIAPSTINGQFAQTVGGQVVWSTLTVPAPAVHYITDVADYRALPAGTAFSLYTFVHGLPGIPQIVDAVLRCIADEGGYTAGQEVDVANFSFETPAVRVPFVVNRDGVNVTVLLTTTGKNIEVSKPTDGTVLLIDRAKWVVKVYATYIP